ncbi:MAG: hypothetical protein H0X02_08085 [Nitrosomonas sp.]|nr:hypothetical protein [Nitrosomonas sp.]
MRWTAQRNIYKILFYQGIEIEAKYNPQTVEEFKRQWGEKLDLNERTGFFEQDAIPLQTPPLKDKPLIRIYFISSDLAKAKIPKKTIASQLLEYLRQTTGMSAEQAFGSESEVSLIKDLQCILISYGHLDGAAKNEITKFNQLFQYPIRHFTIDELQFDPTIHAMGPKRMEILTQVEVDEWIARNRNIMIGRVRLVPGYEERYEELADKPTEQSEYKLESDEEILNKMQTTNTSNPWVKWRGYKVGDVLRIYRRVGNPLVVYRRVVLVEPMATKPPKVKTTQTNL